MRYIKIQTNYVTYRINYTDRKEESMTTTFDIENGISLEEVEKEVEGRIQLMLDKEKSTRGFEIIDLIVI